MRKFIAVAACAGLLSGCVSARSTMLTESTAEVTARGAHSNDRDEVVYATLEEAAKLTRVHGYRYFVILMAEDASHWGSTNVPGLVLNYNRNARPVGGPSTPSQRNLQDAGHFRAQYHAGPNDHDPDVSRRGSRSQQAGSLEPGSDSRPHGIGAVGFGSSR